MFLWQGFRVANGPHAGIAKTGETFTSDWFVVDKTIFRVCNNINSIMYSVGKYQIGLWPICGKNNILDLSRNAAGKLTQNIFQVICMIAVTNPRCEINEKVLTLILKKRKDI